MFKSRTKRLGSVNSQDHEMSRHQRKEPVDMDAYVERMTNGPCFICEMMAGNPNYRHHIIYEDETAVVFLNKCPVTP